MGGVLRKTRPLQEVLFKVWLFGRAGSGAGAVKMAGGIWVNRCDIKTWWRAEYRELVLARSPARLHGSAPRILSNRGARLSKKVREGWTPDPEAEVRWKSCLRGAGTKLTMWVSNFEASGRSAK